MLCHQSSSFRFLLRVVWHECQLLHLFSYRSRRLTTLKKGNCSRAGAAVCGVWITTATCYFTSQLKLGQCFLLENGEFCQEVDTRPLPPLWLATTLAKATISIRTCVQIALSLTAPRCNDYRNGYLTPDTCFQRLRCAWLRGLVFHLLKPSALKKLKPWRTLGAIVTSIKDVWMVASARHRGTQYRSNVDKCCG